ncbi:MAG: hypothetical protein QNJ46_22020 [Leptolyngbyaceae cyanobacterium MO_188.B28]|nr:hypothetical protein [Leptolyngbyaceae cyanobacterium MO_188.B28]
MMKPDSNQSFHQVTPASTNMGSQDACNQSEREVFDEVTTDVLLSPNDYDVYNILPFYKKRLCQFNLEKLYEPCDVFLTAYSRGVKKITQGGKIPNIPAWYKNTGFNIIREYSRSEQRQVKISRRLEDRSNLPEHQDDLFDSSILMNLDILCESLDSLDQLDRRIIQIRIVKGMRWKAITECLISEQLISFNSSTQTIRKKGSRALAKLRKKYLYTQKEKF